MGLPYNYNHYLPISSLEIVVHDTITSVYIFILFYIHGARNTPGINEVCFITLQATLSLSRLCPLIKKKSSVLSAQKVCVDT